MRLLAPSPEMTTTSASASRRRSERRRLAEIIKCDQCRNDKQKVLLTAVQTTLMQLILTRSQCERPRPSQKCLRCAKYNHDCDPGSASARGQLGTIQTACDDPMLNERMTNWLQITPRDLCVAPRRLETEAEISRGCKESSSSSGSSRSKSLEHSTSFTTPLPQQYLPQQYFDDNIAFRPRHDSFEYLTCASTGWLDISEPAFQPSLNPSHVSEPEQAVDVCGTIGSAQLIEGFEPQSSGFGQWSAGATLPTNIAFPQLVSLTNMSPSRIRCPSGFEAHLDGRIGRLWDSGEVFAAAMQGQTSPVFSAAFSGLLRMSRIMAEEGVHVVRPVIFCLILTL
jgi:hypothetical protein